MLYFLRLLACDPSDIPLGEGVAAVEVVISAAPAFDPFAGTTWTFVASGTDTTDAHLVDGSGATVRSDVGRGGWDGKDDAGQWVATGTYSLIVGEDEARFDVAVVRPGLVAAYAEDDGGETALRVPLYWHGAKQLQDATLAFAEVAAIDDARGVRTELPRTTEELDSPEPGLAEPLAYRFDSRPIVSVQLGASSVLGPANLTAADLHLVADGWTVLNEAAVGDGGTVTLQRDESLGSTVGITDEEVVLQVVATDGAGVGWLVSEMHFSARFYRVLGNPTWHTAGTKYAPWVAATAPALAAIEGTAANREAVLDALVRWVYEDNGLSYDTRYGASAYTNYPRGDWEAAQFDMASFLSRKFGAVVNCTDCAGIIVAYGNMLGAQAEYAIIGWNFDLAYILAIGGDTYTRCPFGSGGCGFTYHAVTVSETGESIWDATLALDGDDDTEHTPNELLLVQTIAGDEYLDRLVSTPANYVYQAQGTLQ